MCKGRLLFLSFKIISVGTFQFKKKFHCSGSLHSRTNKLIIRTLLLNSCDLPDNMYLVRLIIWNAVTFGLNYRRSLKKTQRKNKLH